MSMPLFADDVVFLQRFLKCAGLYGGAIDGIWGPKTDAAATAFYDRSDEIAAACGTFDRRTEQHIRTLHPEGQEAARRFMQRILEAGIPARIISGTRTYAEQNNLYHQERFGESNHNFGIAWDIGIFENGAYLPDSPLYQRAAEVGLIEGIEWGGHWKSFPDRPHYQLATGVPIKVVRTNFEGGLAYV